MLSVLFVFVTSIVYVRAFVITYPDSNGWPRNVGLMTVHWDTSPPDPPSFTMLLRDASQSSVVNPLAIAANVPSALGVFELDLPTVPVSQTYQLLFVDPTNLSNVFVTSSIFPITNSNATLSETITQSTLTTTFTLLPSSSTIPPTTSFVNSSTASSTSSPTSVSSTLGLITSILGATGTVTVTATVGNPDATFVPINTAGRLKGMSGWVGPSGIVLLSFYLGGL